MRSAEVSGPSDRRPGTEPWAAGGGWTDAGRDECSDIFGKRGLYLNPFARATLYEFLTSSVSLVSATRRVADRVGSTRVLVRHEVYSSPRSCGSTVTAQYQPAGTPAIPTDARAMTTAVRQGFDSLHVLRFLSGWNTQRRNR